MKSTDAFKKNIEKHLEEVASRDPLFAETLKKPSKNIDDCITYIFNQVQKSGRTGFADEEVYGMAIHYYDENEIEVGQQIKGKVVVNQAVDLSAEEMQQAKQKALDKIIAEEKERLKKKSNFKKDEQSSGNQATLF